MALKIHKLAQAEEDLTEIWRYSFEIWGEAQADSYYDALNRSFPCSSLLHHPGATRHPSTEGNLIIPASLPLGRLG